MRPCCVPRLRVKSEENEHLSGQMRFGQHFDFPDHTLDLVCPVQADTGVKCPYCRSYVEAYEPLNQYVASHWP